MDTLLLAPGPLARRERRAIPGAVCEERATKPAGRSPEPGGEGRVSALLPLLDDVRHRLRRGASHLPARRSRQNGNLFLRETLVHHSVNTVRNWLTCNPVWDTDSHGVYGCSRTQKSVLPSLKSLLSWKGFSSKTLHSRDGPAGRLYNFAAFGFRCGWLLRVDPQIPCESVSIPYNRWVFL